MSRQHSWANWSKAIHCTPANIWLPESEVQLQQLLRSSPANPVRVAGTGHSFVPLCATKGILVSLDQLQGIISVDPAQCQATVWAGTKLWALGPALLEAGLGLANMGDIDRQSLAGAISTGTHGTGQTLGNLSTQVVGLRLLLANGETLDCSTTAQPDRFAAARLSLGALGIITQITLQLLPAYQLHEQTWVASFADCLEQLPTLIANNRHFEFFWSPAEDACAMKALNPTSQPLPDNHLPAPASPATLGRLARYLHPERSDWSHRIFPSERTTLFNEMEFAIPAEAGPDCLVAIRQLMQQRHPAVRWPIEYRTVRADETPLSPAFQRETVTISIHQDATLPHAAFFADAEAIFREHQGRPHWGKMHTHSARALQSLYPRWAEFQAVRAQLDPTERFLNPYLRTLFLE